MPILIPLPLPTPHFDTRPNTRLGFGAIFNTHLHLGG